MSVAPRPVIRLVDPSEVPALAALRREAREAADDPGFEQRFADWLRAEGDRRTTWVAEVDGQLVGCTSLFEYRRMPAPDRPDLCWGYLGNMFVLERHRNAGIGTRLLDAVLAAASARGYARVVLAPTIRAIPFYERAGFVDAGEGAGPDRLMVRPGRTSSTTRPRPESTL